MVKFSVDFFVSVWISLLLFLWSSIRGTLGSLEQTIPEGNSPVCANEQLTYTCKTSVGNIVWQEEEYFYEFTSLSQVNDSEIVGHFFVVLTELNGSALTSTATSFMTKSSDQGILLRCFDGTTLLGRNVDVAAGPDDCKGIVSCSVSADPDSNQYSILTITLDSITGLRCVEHFKFVFNGSSENSQKSPVVANFVIDKTLGSPYTDQLIYTVDGEGRKGKIPCLFNITAPNPITVSSSVQSCSDGVIKVDILFSVPAFPPGNCLDANSVNLTYNITFSNNAHEPIHTTNISVEILVDHQMEFEISITPILPDLSLSASPYSSNIVISTECGGSVWTLEIIFLIIGIAVLSLVIIIVIFELLRCRHQSRRRRTNIDTDFYEYAEEQESVAGCSTVFQPLDNKNGTKEEIKRLQKFIKELILQRLESTPIPQSWLFFLIALRHSYEEDGWCTMEQCCALAAQCNIPAQHVETILEYIHHHIGNILHYADVPDLRDKVFCEPNKLLEAINRVIILSFVGDPKHPNLAQEIRKTGEVPGKLLREIETKAVGFSPITNKEVIILLKHYKNITEIPGKDKIFVPCLLQPDTSIELASHDQLKDVNPPPLLIQFEGGYIPVSVFSGLAVELMSRHEWILKKECRFRNHLTFVSSSCSIELIGHFHFLEVRIFKGTEVLDSPSRQECCLVKENFEASIANVLSLYEHTKGTSFALGFYCPCPLSVEFRPHFCPLISNTQMMCSNKESVHSLGDRDIWFPEPKPHTTEHTAAFTESDKEMTGRSLPSEFDEFVKDRAGKNFIGPGDVTLLKKN